MTAFVEDGLPVAAVCCCAVAEGEPDIVHALEKRGVTVLPVPAHELLPTPVQRHADLQMYLLRDGHVLVLPGTPVLIHELERMGFTAEVCAALPGNHYPQDVPLCCFALGGRLYGRTASMADELKAYYPKRAEVRQGYARCSTCIVNADSLITADRNIAAAATKNGQNVLLIRPGHILLPGYAYGFIGGCCGLIAPDTLAVTGDVDMHPDGAAIRAFCARKGVRVDCLVPGPLRDIGGILPLQQKE